MRKRLRTVRDVREELNFLENSLERLRQSFTLEKDASLENGDLQHLREREKCHYQSRARRMEAELRQLRYLSGRVEGVPRSIFAGMDELERNLKEARAHFVGTVNRLIRCAAHEPGDDECTE